jgi:hypothetical protein
MIRPDTLQNYVRAQPFRPFRITMNSGTQYEIRHPEMIRVGKDFFLFFHATPADAPVDSWETVSLMLIENVRLIDQAAPAAPAGDGAGS